MTSERIKQIQETTAYPESVSVQQALLQVWNECGQEYQQQLSAERERAGKLVELLKEVDKSLYIGDDLNDIDILHWYINVITVIKDEIKQTLNDYEKES